MSTVSAAEKPLLVNVGCGRIVHPDWLNYDLVPAVPGVLRLNANGGIPLADGSVDACYSSHVLEHLTFKDAESFIREQHRVLRPGGVIRVVIPDLEAECVNYLAELRACREQGEVITFRYEHRVAELLDQLVRTDDSCRLTDLWKSAPRAEREWVEAQAGYVAAAYCGGTDHRCQQLPEPFFSRVMRNLQSPAGRQRILDTARRSLLEAVAFAIGGRPLSEAVRIGAFRLRGDVHLWMYDSLSLADLLTRCGFGEVRRHELGSSRIPDWDHYALEIRDARPLKPGSLVLEAIKPASGDRQAALSSSR